VEWASLSDDGKNLTIVSFGFLAAQGLTLGLNLVLARSMSPADYGDFNVAVSTIWAANILCLLGLDGYLLKAMPRFAQSETPGRVRSYYHRCLAVVGRACVAFQLASVAGYSAHQVMVHHELHPVVFVLATFPIFALTYFYSRLFMSIGSPFRGVLSALIIPAGTLLLLLANDRLSHWPLTESLAISLFVAAWVVALAVYWMSWRRHSYMAVPPNEPAKAESVLRSSIPFLIDSFFSGALVFLIVLSSEVLLSGEDEVGQLSAIMQIAYLALLVLVSVKVIYMPRVSVLVRGPRAALNAEIRKYFRSAYALLALFLTLVATVGDRFLQVFGTDYTGLHTALVLVSVGMCLNMLVLMIGSILQCLDSYRVLNIVYVCLFAAILVLIKVLDAPLGVGGVGWALILPNLAAYVFLTLWSKRRHQLQLY